MTSPIEESLRAALTGQYEILEECGRGGTSVVYRARDLRGNRIVALKVMRPELATSATAERFLREIRIAATIEHPNVARLLDSGEVDGNLYCVLEFIEGETLRARLTREGPQPIEDALRLTKDIGSALTWAHSRGIIHRDVKPENILLSGGRAILSDFGIARAIMVAAGDRLTESGVAVGTASYMSPEQATGSAVLDERTDQYALAVCLYEMLAGDPPFAGRTSTTVMARQVAEPPPRLELARPTIPPGIIAAVEKALAKVPADRYASVAEFIGALESQATRLMRARRRPSWIVGAVAGLGLAAIAVLAWVFANRLPPLDDARVVVFPARTGAISSDPDEGLRIADAIQVAVEHTEPLRWIPAWDDLDSATRADPAKLQLKNARKLALRRGARYFMTSAASVSTRASSITLFLYDAAGDTLVAQESLDDSAGVSGPTAASALAIRALPPLLSRMLAPGRRVDLSPLTDRKLTAITRLLEGEAAYRTARFSTAFDRYREAVAEDSLFAYAAIKGAQAASWQNRLTEAIDLIRIARVHEALLPPKYVPYLKGVDAYLEGRGNDAVSGFKEALRMDDRWAEAAMALGDTYYHLMPSEAPLDSLANIWFERAREIDSTFTPPLFHLGEVAARNGDAARARRYIDRLASGGAEGSWTWHLSIMLRCAEGRLSAADWKEAVTASPDEAMIAAHALAGAGRQPRCATEGFRAVLADSAAPAGARWGALLGLHGLLVAQGRSLDAIRLLDSARTAGRPRAYSIAALTVHADTMFAQMARNGAAFARSRVGDAYERAPAKIAWVFGLFEAWEGNRAVVDSLSRRLSRLSAESPENAVAAASLNGRSMLFAGDSDGALNQLLELPPVVAPRDSLLWEYFEPLAPDRLTLAQLLLARHRPADALVQASAFDHPQPVSFLAFLRPSLELRVRAADQLGLTGLANRLRARLRALDGSGPGGR